jgi:PAS domain-containing protein
MCSARGGRVHEEEVNIRIADLLNSLSKEFGLDCRPERPSGRRRPDIRCYYRGFNIVIESSYDKRDAERDARRRIEEDGFDIAIALWLKEGDRYRADLSTSELEKVIRSSRFDTALFIPSPQSELLKFITGRVRAKLSADWFVDVDLNFIRDLIMHSIEYLIAEEEVQVALNKVIDGVNDFVQKMSTHAQHIWQDIYDILYRLYGLSLTETRDVEVVFGQAGLSILLSTVFYEHVRSAHSLGSIHSYVENHGPIEGLRRALEELLKYDYRTAVETTIKILDRLPPTASNAVRRLIDLGIWVSQNSYLLRRDFAGRVYHNIVGDIAHKKGFATFYTEVPAAYLLATLATYTLFGIDESGVTSLNAKEAQGIASKVSGVKVGDFACGSGTLLTATYSALTRLVSTMKLRHNVNISLDDVGKALIEDGVYGIDALRYASQITAINLALIGPQGKITKENVFTIYLGILNKPNRVPWLGSLELLNNGKRVGGILEFIEGGLQGAVEKVSVSGVEGVFAIPDEFDLIIMNPPFTRATGRTETYGERRGLLGFVADENARQNLLGRLDDVRNRARQSLIENARAYRDVFPNIIREIIDGRRDLSAYLNIGQAGEGLLFLYLAHRFVRNGGVIAFVLPRNLLMGVSWFLARVLLATNYHLKYVIVSSDPENGYNFSEGTSLSEVLIVAKRRDKHSPDEETVIINLLRKPNTALEAIALADEIMKKKYGYVSLGENMATAYVTRVKRSDLLNYILNWNILVYEGLFKYLDSMIKRNEVEIGGITVRMPLSRFNDLITDMGVNRRGDVIEAFNLIVRGNRVACDTYRNRPNVPYIPMICGGGEEVANKMLIQPNAYVPDMDNSKARRIKSLRTRFFLPNRIRWNTRHVLALRTTEPAISNVYFMVRTSLTEEQEKALVLWLNSFWGILTVFAFMEITEEAFTSLNIAQWRVLPVLNVRELNEDTVKCLANAFDKYANADFGRLTEQFGRGTRMEMDVDVIKCLSTSPISADEEATLRSELKELYEQFSAALRQISRRNPQ